MVAGVFLTAGILLESAARSDVGLVADDRIELGRLGSLIELKRAVEVAVVGDRQGIHAELNRPVDQPVDGAGSVEQAVVAVAVKVDERLRGHPCARSGGCGIVPDEARFSSGWL